MKKLILTCFLVLMISNISAIVINEVEMNPLDGSDGKEWVELYNDKNEAINISGWELHDGVKKRHSIPEGTIIEKNDFYVIELSSAVLNNDGDFVILYNNEGNEIDRTETLKDSKWSLETWQLCDSWEFLEATKGEKNKCETKEEESELPSEQNEKIINDTIEEFGEEVDVNKENGFVEGGGGGGGITSKVIQLTPKDIKSEENIESLDKTDYVKYGFIGFCILIGVLLILKNKKKSQI